MKQGWMIVLGLALLAGCVTSKKHDRPPAASFTGTLSEQAIPPSILGPDWKMEEGLMVDDVAHPPKVSPIRQAWVDKFFAQKQASGVRSYGEFFYFRPETPPVKVSALILVYHDAEKARMHWNETYGPGLLVAGYKRTNEYGDKSVENSKYDELVVLAGNVVLQVSQPVPSETNERILKAYMQKLGVDNAPPGAPQ